MNGRLLASGTYWFTKSPESLSYSWLNRLQCLLLGERTFSNSSLIANIDGFGQYAAYVADRRNAS